MELVKQNIHMDRMKCLAGTQITLENDVNIPDSRPDAQSIVLSKGNVAVEECKASDNHVMLRGKLHYRLLVQAMQGEMYTIHGEIPFEEQVYMEGATAADTPDVMSTLEDLNVELINSRKLSVQAVAAFKLHVCQLWDEEIATGMLVNSESDGAVECHKSKKNVTQVAIMKKDIFRIKEEIELPQNYPNIMELVWSDVQLTNVEFRLLEEKIAVQGSAQIFLLYESEGEEGKIRAYETSVPFGGTIECYGCKETFVPAIRFEKGMPTLETRTDFDGEERVVGLEVILNMDICLYEEGNVEYVDDFFGIDKEVEPVKKDAYYKKLVLCSNDKMKVTGQLETPHVTDGILQIMHTCAGVQMDDVRLENKTIVADGAVHLQVLLATGESEKPYVGVQGFLPFTHEIPLGDNVSLNDNNMWENMLLTKYQFDVQPMLSAVMTTLGGNGELEAKAVVHFTTLVFENETQQQICDVQMREVDAEKRANIPGIVGYIVGEGDKLWDIAKRYYVPVSQIVEFNNLSGEIVRTGDKLLLVKQGHGAMS